MINNYFKIAIRNLFKFKAYSVINITGLSIGMAIFLLAIIYLRFEMTYDEFHLNKDRIFRMVKNVQIDYFYENRIDCGTPLAPLLRQNYSQIEQVARLYPMRRIVKYNEKSFEEQNFCFVDKEFLNIFSFDLMNGSKNNLLNDPSSVVITEEIAKKYFGSDDPINKNLSVKISSKQVELRVSGVLKNIPGNSHIQINFLASFEVLKSVLPDNFFTSYWESPVVTYILLKNGANPGDLLLQLPELVNKHVDKGSYRSLYYLLQPLKEIYFNSMAFGGGRYKQGNKDTVLIFVLISTLILILACINYINLSTSRSVYRFKEVGIRRVLGSQKSQLRVQFIGESLVFVFLAAFFAILLLELLLPAFSEFTGISSDNSFWSDPYFITSLLGMIFLTCVVSGVYPAFFLAASTTCDSLKGKIKYTKRPTFRKIMVVFQFLISVLLILGTITIYRQVNLLKHYDMGFDKENVILLPIKDAEVLEKYPVIKSELLKLRGIKNITASSQIPGLNSPNGISISSKPGEEFEMSIIYVDYDYVSSLNIPVIKGRDFRKEIVSDESSAVLVNQKFLESMNWPNIENKNLEMYFKEKGSKIPMYSAGVIGVLKDFNFRNLLNSIRPIIFIIDKRRYENIIIKLEKGNQLAVIDNIKKTFKNIFPSKQAEISFLDQKIEESYKGFEKFGLLIFCATLLAIFIASLGLLGLTLFIIEKRTKEIGIRKVLGASVFSIIITLSKEFWALIIISSVIAGILAPYLMEMWLSYFPYRVNVDLKTMILSGLFALIAASLALGFQAIKAALANPVKSLKYE